MGPIGWPGSPYLFDQSTFASFAHFEEFEEIPTHTKTMTTKIFSQQKENKSTRFVIFSGAIHFQELN